MRQRELEFFRRLLETRRREILSEAERAVGSMNSKPEEAFADPTDRATLESDRNFQLRLRDRERKLLAKIDEAFERIERRQLRPMRGMRRRDRNRAAQGAPRDHVLYRMQVRPGSARADAESHARPLRQSGNHRDHLPGTQ